MKKCGNQSGIKVNFQIVVHTWNKGQNCSKCVVSVGSEGGSSLFSHLTNKAVRISGFGRRDHARRRPGGNMLKNALPRISGGSAEETKECTMKRKCWTGVSTSL